MKPHHTILLALCMPGMHATGQTLDWLQHYGGDPADHGVQHTEICTDPEGGIYLTTAIGGDTWDPDGEHVEIISGSDILFQHFSANGALDWTLSTGGGCINVWEYPSAMFYHSANERLYVGGVHKGIATLGNFEVDGGCEETNMFLAAIDPDGTPTAFKSVIGTSVNPSAMSVDPNGALEVYGNAYDTPAIFSSSPFISTEPGVFRAVYDDDLIVGSAERILRTGNISAAFRNGQYQVLAGNFVEADTLWGAPLEPGAPQCTGFLCKRTGSDVTWVRTVTSSFYSSTGMTAPLSGGDIIITGVFMGDADFGTLTLESDTTILTGYMARYTTNGDLVWARKVDAPGLLSMGKVVGDNNNGFYMAGSFAPTMTIGNATVQSTTLPAFYVAHINASGAWDGMQQMGPTWFDRGLGLAVDTDGIYVAGNFDSTMVVDGQQFAPRHANSTDLFVARFNDMEPVTGVQPMAEIGNDVLHIYANPTDGRCSISLPGSISAGSQIHVQVFDDIGNLVQQVPITVNEQRSAPLVIEAEASGVYHVEVLHGGQRYAGTLVFDR